MCVCGVYHWYCIRVRERAAGWSLRALSLGRTWWNEWNDFSVTRYERTELLNRILAQNASSLANRREQRVYLTEFCNRTGRRSKRQQIKRWSGLWRKESFQDCLFKRVSSREKWQTAEWHLIERRLSRDFAKGKTLRQRETLRETLLLKTHFELTTKNVIHQDNFRLSHTSSFNCMLEFERKNYEYCWTLFSEYHSVNRLPCVVH